MKIPEISGVHRPPEGQGQNGVTRAQSWTGGGVARGGRYGKNITIFFLKYHDSQFYHDSLSCWFFYFASCLSITDKLISLL